MDAAGPLARVFFFFPSRSCCLFLVLLPVCELDATCRRERLFVGVFCRAALIYPPGANELAVICHRSYATEHPLS